MMGKLKEPKFKNLDEEMEFYANIDRYALMQAATPPRSRLCARAWACAPAKPRARLRKNRHNLSRVASAAAYGT
jgi:hypothetical protein